VWRESPEEGLSTKRARGKLKAKVCMESPKEGSSTKRQGASLGPRCDM